VSDAEELRLQRKQRQTEGLGLFAAASAWADAVMGEPYTATEALHNRASNHHVDLTSHPDSVAGQSQAGLILRHLQSGGTLTAMDALDLFGCNRLAARVADLKGKGYNVKSRWLTLPNGKRVSEYYLTAGNE
jgi:hypothetical protein